MIEDKVLEKEKIHSSCNDALDALHSANRRMQRLSKSKECEDIYCKALHIISAFQECVDDELFIYSEKEKENDE